MNEIAEQKCGFIAVIGLPNAGKSTLVNHLVGQKVTIVSHKVQTTRQRVMGIVIEGNAQLIFIDTPGVFDAKRTLERKMVSAAWDALDQADAIVHLIDVSNPKALELNKPLIKRFADSGRVVLALNKVDKIKKEKLLELVSAFQELYDYDAFFMISALSGSGVDKLLLSLADNLPQGEWIFDEDQITDMPMRALAAEITREKIFERLHKELPYEIFVQTENWEEFDNGSVKIDQQVLVQKDTQRAIVLGKGGQQIKQIGQSAREELSEMMGRTVHLKIHVKTQSNWSERAEYLAMMGLDGH